MKMKKFAVSLFAVIYAMIFLCGSMSVAVSGGGSSVSLIYTNIPSKTGEYFGKLPPTFKISNDYSDLVIMADRPENGEVLYAKFDENVSKTTVTNESGYDCVILLLDKNHMICNVASVWANSSATFPSPQGTYDYVAVYGNGSIRDPFYMFGEVYGAYYASEKTSLGWKEELTLEVSMDGLEENRAQVVGYFKSLNDRFGLIADIDKMYEEAKAAQAAKNK